MRNEGDGSGNRFVVVYLTLVSHLLSLLAKNLILAGPKAVTVYDNSPTHLHDLGCNYFLSEGQLGAKRCETVVGQLAELNSYVQVQSYVGELTEEVLNKFRVSIVCCCCCCMLLLLLLLLLLFCCCCCHQTN